MHAYKPSAHVNKAKPTPKTRRAKNQKPKARHPNNNSN